MLYFSRRMSKNALSSDREGGFAMSSNLRLNERLLFDGGIGEPAVKHRSDRTSARARPQTSGADAFARMLFDLGVRRAFGLFGGAIAQVCAAMRRVGIEIVHARHESGAVFMAAEAHFASDEPVVVFTTTGPGASNAITGLISAAWDGAKLIAVTGGTDLPQRGRTAFQETGTEAFDISGWIGEGPRYLHQALESEAELAQLGPRLAEGLAHPGGFLATITMPLGVQQGRTSTRPTAPRSPAVERVSAEQIGQIIERLEQGPFVIWLGHGARKAAPAIRKLAERAGMPVIASPRAKGVFPETHPLYLGVTGMFGGHSWVSSYFRAQRPEHVLVLGTRLGQTTSCFDSAFTPRRGFIHVDVDASVFGAAYPEVETLGVTADVGDVVEALIERWPSSHSVPRPKRGFEPFAAADRDGPVHPRSLMAAVQRVVVEGSNAMVLSDTGNAFAWANHELRFDSPGRYRTATAFASMTKATSGVVGAALASGGTAVALVGDGAMLMGNELSTAVKHGADAKWIVLNDASYGMVHHGMIAIGMEPFETAIPPTNFELLAVALGAQGLRVRRPEELDAALATMLATPGPVVVDVDIDPRVPPPFRNRNETLGKGWE
jgi:acetolactate synthase I/II/III large subunit